MLSRAGKGVDITDSMLSLDVGQSLDLVPGFLKVGKIILPRYCRDIAANICSISAPKMEGASAFLHAESGFLKKYSLEAEESHF